MHQTLLIVQGSLKYIVYYSKRPDDDLGDWARTSVDGDKREITITVDDEDTPYNVRVQAATKDGVGIISEAYDVTTGKKLIVNPMIRDTDEETTVEPMQNIRFKCVAEGRPTPQILYSWLPFNETESGQVMSHFCIIYFHYECTHTRTHT
uniref:Ig-like domain-containing protein n=1 Tax=Parascaris equorum TaxID=6256 RepID=A0A914S2I2_PAREQ